MGDPTGLSGEESLARSILSDLASKHPILDVFALSVPRSLKSLRCGGDYLGGRQPYQGATQLEYGPSAQQEHKARIACAKYSSPQ